MTSMALKHSRGVLGVIFSGSVNKLPLLPTSSAILRLTKNSCNFSTDVSKPDNNDNADKIRKSVFISQSYDIFTNLALEDWIYKNYDFGNHHVLMLWINDPCVVVGRHQNPFTETNVSQLQAAGVELARRNSGGGTVFHDRNNLNCTFFTPRERYDRKYNLSLITRAIYREYGIDTEISPRDDITLHGKKVSLNSFLRAACPEHDTCFHHRLVVYVAYSIFLLTTREKKEKNEK